MTNNIWFCFQRHLFILYQKTHFILNMFPFSFFSTDRLQLPMEASCVCLSLFSTQIKRTHRWLWVAYIIFQSQSGHACIQIILEKKRSFSFRRVDILNNAEYCSSKASENHACTFLLKQCVKPWSHCRVYCLFLFYSPYRSPRLAMSSVVSVCC